MPDSNTILRREFLRGAIDHAVLGLLNKAPLHGYGITQAIRQADESFASLHSANLYPILRRLEAAGFIKGAWQKGKTHRPIRVYEMTSKGRHELTRRRSLWTRMTKALNLLSDTPA